MSTVINYNFYRQFVLILTGIKNVEIISSQHNNFNRVFMIFLLYYLKKKVKKDVMSCQLCYDGLSTVFIVSLILNLLIKLYQIR